MTTGSGATAAVTADSAAREVAGALRGLTDRAMAVSVASVGIDDLVDACTSATGRTRVSVRPGGVVSGDGLGSGRAAVGGWVVFVAAATSVDEVAGSLDGFGAEGPGVPSRPSVETEAEVGAVADAVVDRDVLDDALRGVFFFTGLVDAEVCVVADGLPGWSFAAEIDSLLADEFDEADGDDAEDDDGEEPAEPSAPAPSA